MTQEIIYATLCHYSPTYVSHDLKLPDSFAQYPVKCFQGMTTKQQNLYCTTLCNIPTTLWNVKWELPSFWREDRWSILTW